MYVGGRKATQCLMLYEFYALTTLYIYSVYLLCMSVVFSTLSSISSFTSDYLLTPINNFGIISAIRESSSSGLYGGVIGGVVGVLIILVITLGIIFYRRKKGKIYNHLLG